VNQYSEWAQPVLLKDYSVHYRLLYDALFLYRIPLLQVHKLNTCNIGTFPDNMYKIVIENQVYDLNYLGTDQIDFLGNLITDAPGNNPIFNDRFDQFGQRISISNLRAFYRKNIKLSRRSETLVDL